MSSKNMEDRIKLAKLPTPLMRLNNYSDATGVNVYAKRDDMTGSELSGNKARKLEYVFKRVLDGNYTGVVTCGGPNSNHARAVAVAARQLGVVPHVLLRDYDPRAQNLGNVLMLELLGAQITSVTPEQYAQIDDYLYNYVKGKDEKIFVIPEGASDRVGARGYINAVDEMKLQTQRFEEGLRIFHAVGSGGTTAGLAAGIYRQNLDWRVEGVLAGGFVPQFKDKIDGILDSMGVSEANYELIGGFQGGGFGELTRADAGLIRMIARTDGMILDPMYGVKAFRALNSMISRSVVKKGEDVIFLNSGGLPSLDVYSNKLR
jgi:D-cysteine desulfhydrase